jgi:hypothetical protein
MVTHSTDPGQCYVLPYNYENQCIFNFWNARSAEWYQKTSFQQF